MLDTLIDCTHANESDTDDVDALTHALDRLLTRHRSVLHAEGMDRQVEKLKRWLEENRKDFGAAGTVSETGDAWLSDLRNGLKLAVEERQRLEGEGGLPATKEQADQTEELCKTIRRIEKILHRDLPSQ